MSILKRENSVSKVHQAMRALNPAPKRSDAEEIDINRAQLAVRSGNEDFDDIENEFFAKGKTISELLSADDAKALDAMMERAGLRGVLLALVSLLESRVEDGVFRGDTLILHLSRGDRFAAAAEALQNLSFNRAFDL